jgi:hypothetical protein
VVAKGGGRAVASTVAPSRAHELPFLSGLLDRLSNAPFWVMGDHGLASCAFREHV